MGETTCWFREANLGRNSTLRPCRLVIPSPRDGGVGRGLGRGESTKGVNSNRPLSPALSPLVPRGEREPHSTMVWCQVAPANLLFGAWRFHLDPLKPYP